MILRILNRLFEHKTIHNCFGNEYLTRWHLCRNRFFTAMLHRFHRSDEDRAFHDHPWSFITVLLWRGYYEHTATGRRRKLPLAILWRPAEWRHRVELLKDKNGKEKESWSLVFHFRRRREWGYWYPTGFQHHKAWWNENCE